ncbi:MAG: hypothetical protein BroJett026_07910 [Betaproteobacteria bacterium]|nr:MAG: hypothetical protein BroJett026_07910 [Betaproteobacteria bacterium]
MPNSARSPLVHLAAAVALALAAAAADAGAPVPYPEGYRQWTHVKSMQILPGHPLYDAFGGVHHIYANAKAMQGYRDGRFPDGAVIVFDLRDARTEGSAVTAGARKVVGVMHRDAKRWADTGGWGFEGFKGDSRTERAVGADAKTACFGCHAPQQARDYVFSAFER